MKRWGETITTGVADKARAFVSERVVIEDRGHTSPCWVWQSRLTEKGYGDCRFNGIHTRAHRVAYFGFVGEIPDGLQLDHLCRVKECCNPDHLEPVTNEENQRRARREFCKSGRHRLTEEDRRSGCFHCRREKHRLYMRGWYSRNRELAQARSREHHAANRERRNAQKRAKRAAERAAL